MLPGDPLTVTSFHHCLHSTHLYIVLLFLAKAPWCNHDFYGYFGMTVGGCTNLALWLASMRLEMWSCLDILV